MALRIPINLATEPFRRDRQMLMGSAAIALLLALLLVFQVFKIVSERHQAADIRIAIDRENEQIRAISAQQAKLNATLRKPENAVVLERSLFLNTLIDRKAISWTKIFADLEKVVPYNVRLISIRPAVNSQNQIVLEMHVGAERTEYLLQLLKKLESSELFGHTSVSSSLPPSQTDPLYRLTVNVNYAQKL